MHNPEKNQVFEQKEVSDVVFFKEEDELIIAVRNHDNEKIKALLLLRTDDKEIYDKKGNTLLSIAIKSQFITTVCTVLTCGKFDPDAPINKDDKSGITPLIAAIKNENPTLTKVHLIKALLQAGADVNKPDINGDTPLHWLYRQGEDDIGRLCAALASSSKPINSSLKNKAGYMASDKGSALAKNLDGRIHPSFLRSASSKPEPIPPKSGSCLLM